MQRKIINDYFPLHSPSPAAVSFVAKSTLALSVIFISEYSGSNVERTRICLNTINQHLLILMLFYGLLYRHTPTNMSVSPLYAKITIAINWLPLTALIRTLSGRILIEISFELWLRLWKYIFQNKKKWLIFHCFILICLYSHIYHTYEFQRIRKREQHTVAHRKSS